MPSGPEFKIPLSATLEAHRAHLAGWSIRALGRLHWEMWGYASPECAAVQLGRAFKALELPARSSTEAARLAHTIHGNLSRALLDPEHPEHRRYLEHKLWLRDRRRERAA